MGPLKINFEGFSSEIDAPSKGKQAKRLVGQPLAAVPWSEMLSSMRKAYCMSRMGSPGASACAEAGKLGAQEILGESPQSTEPCPFQLLGFSPGGSMGLTDSWSTLASFLPILKTNRV